MNRYLDEKTKAQRDLEEWRRYLREGLREGLRPGQGGYRKGARKLSKDETGALLRMPGDPMPLIRWS